MKLSDLRQLSALLSGTGKMPDQQQLQALLRQIGIDPYSLYQELEMESPFVDTHQDISYAGSAMPLHSHSFTELLCCTNTVGVEYLVGSERYLLQKNDIVMIPPGFSHCPLLPENMPEPYKRNVLWLQADFLHQLHDSFPADQIYHISAPQLLRTADTKWEFISELFEKGVQEAEHRKSGWEAFILGNTIQILVQLNRAMQDRATKSLRAEKPDLLDQVMAYIEENLSQHITLSDIAQRFYISESTISHTFKEKMGISFYRCVTQRRLIAAKNLISQNVLLETVGSQVGFSDYSSFYRAFKQEYGISPRQYRKMQ